MRAALLLVVLLGPGTAGRSSAQAPAPSSEASPAATPAATPAASSPAAPSRAAVATAGAQIEVGVSPEQVTIGDVVEWEVRVDAPESVAVSEPALVGAPVAFELRESFRLVEERSDAGRSLRRFVARAAVFETGNQALPAAEIELRGAGESSRVLLPAVGVNVQSVLAPQTTPVLKGAKGLFRLSAFNRWWLALALLAVVAALAIYYWRARRPVQLGGRAPVSEVPYDERALNELRQLAASSLLKEGRSKDFHVRLLDIVRAYLGGRYRFEALEATSDELNRALRERRAEPQARDLVRALTELADLVKFARHLPPAFENEQALANAFRLVDTTRPRRETAVPAAASPAAPGPELRS